MEKFIKMIEQSDVEGPFTNTRLVTALSLEAEVSQFRNSMLNCFISEIKGSIMEQYLPSIYKFEKHNEWNASDESLMNERLENAVFLYYVKKGYEMESIVDKDITIRTFLRDMDIDLYFSEITDSVSRKIKDQYYCIFKSLIEYVEHLNRVINKILFDTLDDIFCHTSLRFMDRFIENVLFVYGLYVEILEIYDPKKLEV